MTEMMAEIAKMSEVTEIAEMTEMAGLMTGLAAESEAELWLREPSRGLLAGRGLSPEELFVPGLAWDELREMAGDLREYDALFHRWRYRHWLLVVRALGTRPGTGGSVGEKFLRKTLDK